MPAYIKCYRNGRWIGGKRFAGFEEAKAAGLIWLQKTHIRYPYRQYRFDVHIERAVLTWHASEGTKQIIESESSLDSYALRLQKQDPLGRYELTEREVVITMEDILVDDQFLE